MKLHTGLVFAGLLGLGLVNYSCANGDTVSGGDGSGGNNNSGSGGSSNSGGSNGNGGSSNKGGTTGSGGSTNKGGTTGSGGAVSSGGSTGTGGRGGTTGSGGAVSSGGTTGSGGTVVAGTGGATSSGGTTGTDMCMGSFATTTTGFVTMPVKNNGCWAGYAYSFADTYGTTIMPVSPTPGFSACGMPCNLTVTGNIVAVTGSNYSYAGVAFNLGQTSAGGTTNTPVTPTGNGLVISYTASVPTGLPVRIQISDASMNNYCYTATASPASIPYGSFNTKCYDTPADGTAYAKTIPIAAIQLQVAGGTGSGAYTLTITSVTEN
jgi:hypothetical protein